MDSLNGEDVRGLLRLVGELRELGEDPAGWRKHLAEGLETMCGSRAVVVGELRPKRAQDGDPTCRGRLELVGLGTVGIEPDERSAFIEEVLWIDYKTDPVLSAFYPYLGVDVARARWEVVGNDDWYRSTTANERFRPNGVDDFILAQAHSPADPFVSMHLYRPWGEPMFTGRERAIVELVNGEIVRSLAVDTGPRLGPRRRAVLAGLQSGASEKEIAAALDLSPHTTHDHVKAIYRAFGVRARPELMAMMAARPRRRLRLASHG
jgi:DNA-binding CsgD family transcriptional regulator